MFCLETVSFDSDDATCDENSLSRASNGAVIGRMTDSQYPKPFVITPECAGFTSSHMMPLLRAEHHRQSTAAGRRPLWDRRSQGGGHVQNRFQTPSQDSGTCSGKPLENHNHKVVDPLYSFPRFTTSEMKEDHLPNQQTTSIMTMPAPKMAQAPQSHDVNHDGDTSYAQRTSPSKRSRSIMIKRNRGSDEYVSSSVSASTEQMYDWATWRMYHRITSARKTRSAVMPLVDVPSSGPLSSFLTYRSSAGFPKDSMGDYTVHGGLAVVDDGSDEGVFVMDM